MGSKTSDLPEAKFKRNITNSGSTRSFICLLQCLFLIDLKKRDYFESASANLEIDHLKASSNRRKQKHSWPGERVEYIKNQRQRIRLMIVQRSQELRSTAMYRSFRKVTPGEAKMGLNDTSSISIACFVPQAKIFFLAIDHCSVNKVAEVLALFYLLWNYCPRLHLAPYKKNAKIPPSPNKLGFIFREPELVRQMRRNAATEAEFCPKPLIIPVTNALPPNLTLKPTDCNELSSKKRLGSHSSLSYSRADRLLLGLRGWLGQFHTMFKQFWGWLYQNNKQKIQN